MIAYAYALYLHILGDTHSYFYTQIFSIRVRISSQSSMSPEGADHSRMDMMDMASVLGSGADMEHIDQVSVLPLYRIEIGGMESRLVLRVQVDTLR